MELTPDQVAVAEQDALNAAFDRARAKLASARGELEQHRVTAPWASRPVQKLQYAFWLLACIAAPVSIAVFVPETLSHTVWATDPRFPLMVVVALGFLTLALVSYRKRIAMSAPERIVRDFYSAASELEGKIAGVSEFVIAADLDGASRRRPGTNPEAALPPLNCGKDVDLYWTNLRRLSPRHRQLIAVEKVSLSQVEPDLYLASVKLRVTRVRKQLFVLSYLVILIPVLFNELQAYGWWIYLAAFGAAGLAWLGLLRLLSRGTEVHRVRKLLVRCGKDWRFFCADWEAWEEHDLSWLDANP
ncbi:MAG: hypothetical protein KDB90_15465 [Planctomycetes bacterium]|nr:hypothetical protein [Planctomycetota bacterium]